MNLAQVDSYTTKVFFQYFFNFLSTRNVNLLSAFLLTLDNKSANLFQDLPPPPRALMRRHSDFLHGDYVQFAQEFLNIEFFLNSIDT